jgi:hypothetical protein
MPSAQVSVPLHDPQESPHPSSPQDLPSQLAMQSTEHAWS